MSVLSETEGWGATIARNPALKGVINEFGKTIGTVALELIASPTVQDKAGIIAHKFVAAVVTPEAEQGMAKIWLVDEITKLADEAVNAEMARLAKAAPVVEAPLVEGA